MTRFELCSVSFEQRGVDWGVINSLTGRKGVLDNLSLHKEHNFSKYLQTSPNLLPTTFVSCNRTLPFMQTKPAKIKAFLFFKCANRTAYTSILFALSFTEGFAFGALLDANCFSQIIFRQLSFKFSLFSFSEYGKSSHIHIVPFFATVIIVVWAKVGTNEAKFASTQQTSTVCSQRFWT